MSRLNRVVVAAVLAIAVMFTGGVVGANPQPAPRGVCTKVGQVVSAPVPLVCKQTVKNGLRWRKAPITTTTTTSTTPVAPSTTVAVVPTVSLAATFLDSGTFPKAAVVTTNVAGTVYFIEGASPVNTVSDITSARYYRWTSGVVAANTPTSIALDVDVLTNGYYRVFVANSQGVLSETAFNKVTISITRASSVVALTCATGGICAVGDTGPGGGVVFYVEAAGDTFACGAALASTCKYLEAAPANWLTGTTVDPTRTWATNVNSNWTTAVAGADESTIGAGYQNSLDTANQTGNVAGSSAAVLALSFRGGSKTDWHLPSKDELNQLCRYAWTLAISNTTSTCIGMSGSIRTGFSADSYWSSSEFSANFAWYQYFGDYLQDYSSKNGTAYVRPVRAFGGTLACADGGVCAVGDTGPGGGVVFYVSASNFTSTGSDCDTECKYLEAATTDQSTNVAWATTDLMCFNTDDSNNGDCQTTSVYSGSSSERDSSRAASEAIRMGMVNTENFAGRLAGYPENSTSFATGIARTYLHNGKTDWHLPSKDELNELFLKRARVGGFSTGRYWSSSEAVVDDAWAQSFFDGLQTSRCKECSGYVRPVRAF